MFNIEMIGTESKWGTNSAITGFEKSDMGKILQANLEGSKFHFEPDPYQTEFILPDDNATSPNWAYLHADLYIQNGGSSQQRTQLSTNKGRDRHLDMNNMAEIIKAIALNSKTIISGKDTPSRVEKVK